MEDWKKEFEADMKRAISGEELERRVTMGINKLFSNDYFVFARSRAVPA